MNLQDLGWNPFFENSLDGSDNNNHSPARVAEEHRNSYIVYSELGEHKAELTGKFRFTARDRSDFPTVGDWVVADFLSGGDTAVVHALLPRKSSFSRKVAGSKTEEHVVAANVDIVFLVSGLDHDFNLRRIERYVTGAWNSGATPVILLNKCDLYADIEDRISGVESIAPGVDIHPVSAKESVGLDAVSKHIRPGRTAAFLGSSGVGKSSLINCLLGENRMKVKEVREDDSRGRHTTTHRQLIRLPSGGLVIDTPGLRELQLWTDEEVLNRSFDDIAELAGYCRFSDCSHTSEPGCAVMRAVEAGLLERSRLDSYLKLQKELAYLERRQNQKAAGNEKAKWKQITKTIRKMRKDGTIQK